MDRQFIARIGLLVAALGCVGISYAQPSDDDDSISSARFNSVGGGLGDEQRIAELDERIGRAKRELSTRQLEDAMSPPDVNHEIVEQASRECTHSALATIAGQMLEVQSKAKKCRGEGCPPLGWNQVKHVLGRVNSCHTFLRKANQVVGPLPHPYRNTLNLVRFLWQFRAGEISDEEAEGASRVLILGTYETPLSTAQLTTRLGIVKELLVRKIEGKPVPLGGCPSSPQRVEDALKNYQSCLESNGRCSELAHAAGDSEIALLGCKTRPTEQNVQVALQPSISRTNPASECSAYERHVFKHRREIAALHGGAIGRREEVPSWLQHLYNDARQAEMKRHRGARNCDPASGDDCTALRQDLAGFKRDQQKVCLSNRAQAKCNQATNRAAALEQRLKNAGCR